MANEQQYTIDVRIINDRTKISSEHAYIIHADNIISINITENILSVLPKIEMVLSDAGDLLENRPIMDQDMLFVTMGGRNNPEDVSMVFTISSFYFESDTLHNQSNTMKIVGYMECDGMMVDTYRRAFKGSSDEVIGEIINEIGLNYDSRVSGNESITWYQNGDNYQFVNHVANRSFISDDGVFVYGTKDGEVVYTSYGTEIVKDVAYIAKYDIKMIELPVLFKSDEYVLFYNTYNYINNTTLFNNAYTYGMVHTSYDLTEYSSLSYKADDKTTDFYNTYKKYKNTISSGIYMNAICDESYSGNIYHGMALNEYYRFNLFTNTMMLNVNPLSEVKLFDKTDLDFPSILYNREGTNNVYSGTYIIGSISYSIYRGGVYSKEVMLCRYGINESLTMDNVEVV